MFEISQELKLRISNVRESDSEIFSELVKIAGLDPAKDFRTANLQDVDFAGSDLSDYDLSFADLRGARWDPNPSFQPVHYRYSLRGRARDAISSTDHAAIFDRAINSRTWGERFFAFALAIDNFGEVYLTFDLLAQLVAEDKSKYLRFTAFTYFLASSLKHLETVEYCRSMALASNSKTNMFRFRKLMRLLNELVAYAQSLERSQRFPGDVHIEEIVSLSQKIMD